MAKRTPETMETMKKEIVNFLKIFEKDTEGQEMLSPRTIGWLRSAAKENDSEKFFSIIEKIGFEKGILDARYNLQLYLDN